ncbi:MAG: hypothetical protein WD708_07630 [Kiritimatiellia bacterium]
MKIAHVIEKNRREPVRHPDLSKKGSALLLTLLVVSLLLVIVLAFTVYVRLQFREVTEYQNLQVARKNAVLGLELALGELQRHAGPDQRATATAALTGPNAEANHPHWVGVWHRDGHLRNWLISGNERVVPPLNSDATPEFSPLGPVSADTASPTNFLIQSMNGTRPAVKLVGPGSVATPGVQVFAPAMEIQQASQITGRYAWWVGDEGVKANIAVAPRERPSNGISAEDVAERQQFFSAHPNRGLPALGGDWRAWIPDGPSAAPDFAENIQKLVIQGQAPFIGGPDENEIKARFHELTLHSAGVLSDSRDGGLRKDFSIAFELPEASFKNSEFTRELNSDDNLAYVTDNEGSSRPLETSSPLRNRLTKTAVNYWNQDWEGLNGYIAPGGTNPWIYRGPTFDLLRDHCQLYRRIQNPFDGNARIDAQVYLPNSPDIKHYESTLDSPSADYAGNQVRPGMNLGNPYGTHGGNAELQDTYLHYGSFNRTYRRIRPLTTQLVPELIRFSYTFSVQSFRSDHDGDPDTPDQWQLRLIVNPFFILHNPYNVTLRSGAMDFKLTRPEMQIEVYPRLGGAPIPGTPDLSRNGEINFDKLVAYAGFNQNESFIFELSDTGSPGGNIELAPGEIRLYTVAGTEPVSAEDVFSGSTTRRISCQAGIGDFFSGGIYVTIADVRGNNWGNWKDYYLPENSDFEVRINAKGEGGGAASRNWPPLDWNVVEYVELDIRIRPPATGDWNHIRLTKYFSLNDIWFHGDEDLPGTYTRLSPPDIQAVPAGPKRYVGKMDYYLKPAKDGSDRDNNFSLQTHNPRAMTQSISISGAQGPSSTRGPVHWTSRVTGYDVTPALDFDNRFWGSETSSIGGSRTIMLFDVPRAPLGSLASLQHANLSRLPTAPAHAFANAYASPYVPADRAWWRSHDAPPMSRTNDPSTVNERYWHLDDSYIFNQALFDGYFFSTVHPGLNNAGTAWNNPLSAPSVLLGNSDGVQLARVQNTLDDWRTGTAPLLNLRLHFHLPLGRSITDAETDLNLSSYNTPQNSLDSASDLRPHNTIAAYMLNRGAFNINSTSVTAWRILLSGLRDAAVDYYRTSNSLDLDSGIDETPFPGSSLPGADSFIGSEDQLWNGYRRLTDAQIETLAEEIVAEIKDRARNQPDGAAARPFTTLGEFVNRRLAPESNPFSRKGALQAAIDRSINQNPGSLSGEPVIPATTDHRTVKIPASHSRGVENTTVPYANPSALASATIAGTPQWLTQADVLESIAPLLSARSDTFTIRSYGERVGTGSKAWLEAVVQRDTAFVENTDHPALPLDSPDLSDINKHFGRRFRILSVRWLNPEDI